MPIFLHFCPCVFCNAFHSFGSVSGHTESKVWSMELKHSENSRAGSGNDFQCKNWVYLVEPKTCPTSGVKAAAISTSFILCVLFKGAPSQSKTLWAKCPWRLLVLPQHRWSPWTPCSQCFPLRKDSSEQAIEAWRALWKKVVAIFLLSRWASLADHGCYLFLYEFCQWEFDIVNNSWFSHWFSVLEGISDWAAKLQMTLGVYLYINVKVHQCCDKLNFQVKTFSRAWRPC